MTDEHLAQLQGRIMALEFISRRLLAQMLRDHADASNPTQVLREQRRETLASLSGLLPQPKDDWEHACRDSMRAALEQLFDETEPLLTSG